MAHSHLSIVSRVERAERETESISPTLFWVSRFEPEEENEISLPSLFPASESSSSSFHRLVSPSLSLADAFPHGGPAEFELHTVQIN